MIGGVRKVMRKERMIMIAWEKEGDIEGVVAIGGEEKGKVSVDERL